MIWMPFAAPLGVEIGSVAGRAGKLYARREHGQDPAARSIEREIGALAGTLGEAARAERERKHMTLRQVAAAAGLGFTTVAGVESGRPATLETYVRLARVLHLKPEFALADPRRRSPGLRAQDPVHSAMGEMEASHLRGLGYEVRLDEPFQHF